MSDYQMVIPRRVENNQLTDTYGRFTISPLERGYGTTLGHALRRVLLSSMSGSTVTAVRVNGGLADYDTVPGVRETVTQLILQLKQLRFAMEDEEPVALQLAHDGEGTVYARDIALPSGVGLLTPDLYLFTATEGSAQVTIDLRVESGHGYSAAADRDTSELEDGMIALDTNFSPVARVVIDVDAARVRQRTNYDKLVMDIWTDGTIAPDRALTQSAVLVAKQLTVFDIGGNMPVLDSDYVVTVGEAIEPEPNPLYDVPMEGLDLSTRVFNSLRRTGINTVGDILDMLDRGPDAMLAIRNFGQTSLDELNEKLAEKGYLNTGEEEAEDA